MERLIYENPLSSENDVKDWRLEGQAKVSFDTGCMRLENAMSAENGQKANYVFWCDREFPDDIMITWKFKPVREPGLAIMFFGAKGINGEDIFDEKLQKRTGEYPLYHHGDINAFHVSYFRRKEPDERQFHTCNLRKSYGFNLVAQGADPIPDVPDCVDFYRMKIVKRTTRVEFYVNDLMSFAYDDDEKTYGKALKEGKIGFRQLAPMIGEYSDLKVFALED
ncbi:MAG: YesU family protein [Lachnospiraceae bacterium]|nr:YesU family protein [Lachnospiraceae bacterium]